MIYTMFMDKMAPGILRLSVMDNDLDLFEGQYPVPQGVLEMRVSINLTSRGRKVFRLPEKISVRQRISSLILKQKGQ